MLALARDARRRVLAAEREVTSARDAYARRCLDLHDTGLSLAQIAVGLGITRVEAQRLTRRGRELRSGDAD